MDDETEGERGGEDVCVSSLPLPPPEKADEKEYEKVEEEED